MSARKIQFGHSLEIQTFYTPLQATVAKYECEKNLINFYYRRQILLQRYLNFNTILNFSDVIMILALIICALVSNAL